MPRRLTSEQVKSFVDDGFLVLRDFVDADKCLTLRNRAIELAREHVPAAGAATVFTADGSPRHTSAEYFLTSGEAIRCFFEKDAFDTDGRLKQEAHLSLNKLGHAMHDLDAEFVARGARSVVALLVADEHARTAVAQREVHLVGGPPAVQRYRYEAARHDAGERHHPLGIVAHRDGDAVTASEAELAHEKIGASVGTGERRREVVALVLVHEELLVAVSARECEKIAEVRGGMTKHLHLDTAHGVPGQLEELTGPGDDVDGLLPGNALRSRHDDITM